jgi:anti-sigma B factor antagonist
MSIKQFATGDSVEFVVSGNIDGALSNEIEVEILAAVKKGANTIYVNLSEANYICSAGIRVLLQYYRQLKVQKKTLWVTRPSTEVDAILEMTGFKELIVEGAQKK